MNQFYSLLLDFKSLTKEANARTFLEVSGQSHYENVASNILAFYFNPKEEHGLKDLLLTAFLKMAGYEGVDASETTAIDREYPAEDGKRIDLVIQGSDFVIGIENKIYHWEANDFENYGRVIDKLKAAKTINIKTVLGLHAEAWKPLPPGGFLRFSYAQFWGHVQNLLGLYLPNANPKWVSYLIDFMENTSRLAGESKTNMEFTNFLIKHNTAIEELVEQRRLLIERLNKYNLDLEANLKDELMNNPFINKVQVYQKSVFAVDFLIQGHTLVLDLARWSVVWRLTVFERNCKSQDFLRRFINTESMRGAIPDPESSGERYLLNSPWTIGVTQPDLQDSVLKWANAMVSAAHELADSTL